VIEWATGDANRRIGWRGSKWDFLRALTRWSVARRREQIAEKDASREGQRGSICRWLRLGRG
jgi:hypothetical protein